MRFLVSLLSLSILAACAATPADPNADSSFYDSRTTTGSNIPRKGTSAIVVDKSVLQEQLGRQGGSIQR